MSVVPADHPQLRRGSIYFIECGDFIKIGHASLVDRRFASLQGAIPYELKLLAVTCGSRDFEAKLHRRFAHLLHRNEWFRKAPELMKLIADLQPSVERTANNPSEFLQMGVGK